MIQPLKYDFKAFKEDIFFTFLKKIYIVMYIVSDITYSCKSVNRHALKISDDTHWLPLNHGGK